MVMIWHVGNSGQWSGNWPALPQNNWAAVTFSFATSVAPTRSNEQASFFQNFAMMAEENVQKSIRKAMEMFGIPVHVFRGVNTFDEIGQLLESLGIKMSRLGAFKPGGSGENTFECEHDIAAVALLPAGPLVSFVQVGF